MTTQRMTNPMPGKPMIYPPQCGYPIDHFETNERVVFGSLVEDGAITIACRKRHISWSSSTTPQNKKGSDGFTQKGSIQAKGRQRYRLNAEGTQLIKETRNPKFIIFSKHLTKCCYKDIPFELMNYRNRFGCEGRDCRSGNIKYVEFLALVWEDDIPVIYVIDGPTQHGIIVDLIDEYTNRGPRMEKLLEYLQKQPRSERTGLPEYREYVELRDCKFYRSNLYPTVEVHLRDDRMDNYSKVNVYLPIGIYPKESVLDRIVLTPDEAMEVYTPMIKALRKFGIALPGE